MGRSRYDLSNVNPDLASERTSATFDLEKMTNLLDGGKEQTDRRRKLEQFILEDKECEWPEHHFLDMGKKYDEVIRQCGNYIRKLRQLPNATGDDVNTILSIMFPNVAMPIGLHLGMFINVVENQMSEEQKAKWLPMSQNLEIIGTYAQTELGHGTHVRALETTATYDPSTEEFVMHSPTITSTKFWPGGLGKTANHALVMAQLYTEGKGHGVHPFVVQIRDLKTHEPLPGITVGDIGPKFGYETMDNGFLRMNHVRIPRENMVMRNAQVLKNGRFVKSAGSSKLAYGAMVYTRASIVGGTAGVGLAKAVTIAIRYSCVRRQSELRPGDAEPKVLEFQTQQFKLFPLLASAYAIKFAGMQMMNDYHRLNAEILAGNLSSLQELHATSSGLKALSSYTAIVGIEQCRLACGGHGYSHASGLPTIYTITTPAATYEGENTVLYLQTARYLIKALNQVRSGVPLTGSVCYITKKRTVRSRITDRNLQVDDIVEAFEHRAVSMLEKAKEKLSQLQASGIEAHDAWNLASVMLVKAAECHSFVCVIESFVKMLRAAADENVRCVLTDLFQLYALCVISSSAADFMQDGFLDGHQLEFINNTILLLLKKLRPNAVALVDAFDFHDRRLGSILGRYDGRVYENLYEWAAKSPLNKTPVHKSFQYIRSAMQEGARSKL